MTDSVEKARQAVLRAIDPQDAPLVDTLIEAVRAEGLVAVHQAVLITNAQMNKRITELEEALREVAEDCIECEYRGITCGHWVQRYARRVLGE